MCLAGFLRMFSKLYPMVEDLEQLIMVNHFIKTLVLALLVQAFDRPRGFGVPRPNHPPHH